METTAYDRVPVKVPMRPSPSSTFCNLSLSGNSLFYAHTTQACTLQPGSAVAKTPINVRRVECQCQDFVHTARALPHGETGFLLVCTEGGVQVWDKLAHHLLFIWTFPDVKEQMRHGNFARGAAVVRAADGSANLCYGSSTGKLYALQVDDTARIHGPHIYTYHTAPITALGSAYQSRQGRVTEDCQPTLVSADESGAIAVWQVDATDTYTVKGTLGNSTVPAVSLAVRNGFAIAARLDGTIQIYNLVGTSTAQRSLVCVPIGLTEHTDRGLARVGLTNQHMTKQAYRGRKAFTQQDRTLRAEISAHSRWLTCMDIHPTKDIIVTGAEDGTIGVWTLPIGAQKASVLLSTTWLHAALAGIAFCGTTLDDIAAVAYDTDELHIYKPTKPT